MNNKKKVLYHIPYPSATGADRWIYEGWRDAFCDLGHEFFELTGFDNFEQKAADVKPDIYMTAVNLIDPAKDIRILSALKKKGTKVFMWVHWPLNPACKHMEYHLLNNDLADVYFGEREKDHLMLDFENKVGKPYYVIPNAANKKLHFPTTPMDKYKYDIVYLGAKLPHKRWFTDNVLIPISKKYKVGIFGPYWTLKDNILRALAKLSRYLHSKILTDFFNKFRIVVPAEEENVLYSSAKISLNFHEREPDGSQPHYIVNQRTFKIPACGGFQICDAVPAINQYFTNDEIIMVGYSAADWIKTIEYYLTNDYERELIKAKAAKKAAEKHTYHNRVEQLLLIYSKL